MDITGHTKLACLIGSPVAHSGSPGMYNACFEQLGIDMRYLAFDIQAEHVPIAMLAMKTMGIVGMNVTFPYKQAVVPFMSWMSDAARLIGAVNMIINRDGNLYGYNTDGLGYMADLRANGVVLEGKRFVVAGAGGAATSIIAQGALEGFKEIVVMKRKNETFEQTVSHMQMIEDSAQAMSGSSTRIRVCDSGNEACFRDVLEEADIFCNATNVGMAPNAGESVISDAAWLRPELVVSDIVYNPRETRLMQQAKLRDCQLVLGGIGMLVMQGAENFKLMTGMEMPVEDVRRRLA